LAIISKKRKRERQEDGMAPVRVGRDTHDAFEHGGEILRGGEPRRLGDSRDRPRRFTLHQDAGPLHLAVLRIPPRRQPEHAVELQIEPGSRDPQMRGDRRHARGLVQMRVNVRCGPPNPWIGVVRVPTVRTIQQFGDQDVQMPPHAGHAEGRREAPAFCKTVVQDGIQLRPQERRDGKGCRAKPP
jgi:hypothetical protein